MSSTSRHLGNARNPRQGAVGEAGTSPDYEALVENLHQIVFQTDRAGKWHFLNACWPRLTGFDLDESLATHYLAYIHPRDRHHLQEHFRGILDGRLSETAIPIRLLTEDGKFRWMEVHASPVIDAAGTLSGVAGTLTNITDRVREEELLLANHRTITGLIDDLPGMVYRCRNNPDYTMEYVSAGALELTGYRPEDIINSKTLSYGSLIHSDDQQQVWNEVQCGLRERRRYELVYRIQRADRSEKWVWERGKGIFSSSGELLGLEGFITDITARKRAEERSLQALLHDPDTGLATAPLFHSHLEAALARAGRGEAFQFHLMLIHLERFPRIVDKYGLEFADHVAGMIGERLIGTCSTATTLSRLEDRLFALLLEMDGARLETVSRRVLEQFLSPLVIDGSEIRVSASVGVTSSPAGYRRGEDMLNGANVAMNRAHALGGGRCEFFDPRMDAALDSLAAPGPER